MHALALTYIYRRLQVLSQAREVENRNDLATPGMGGLLYVTEGRRMREPVTDGELASVRLEIAPGAQMKLRADN